MRKVIFSKRATKRLGNLFEYLEREWSSKIKDNFIKKFDKSILQIKLYPNSGTKSKEVEGLHKLVVTKQTSVYYKFDDNTINIITIFDSRMNINRLKNEANQL